MRAIAIIPFLCWITVSPGLRSQSDYPIVPKNFHVGVFAREPMVRNPCAITFDAEGRLFVGMGPQYRKPKPDTPPDSVYLLIDEDRDGVADRRQEFATGFNSIQGLAWKGNELWIANAPDMTVVRDLNGDDVADEYVRLWTDLGNLEHALHGLNWGPDGRLTMSKGNSKGLNQPPDRLAPRPFRELWGNDSPDLPDTLPPLVFSRLNYQRNYHDPSDDWGMHGGVLRCNRDGSGLEIVARGFRNPWDIAYDHGFNWLGTDNDQNLGDKIFSPFYGAHFGWGHSWSYDWKGDDHLPTAPSNGPLFEGSGTGVVFCGVPGYPADYKDVFLINDWLNRQTLVYRPKWEGARMLPEKSELKVLATAGGGRSMDSSSGRSFDPVDIEIGPEGAIYISSWGREYGLKMENGEMVNEGRIYRILPTQYPITKEDFPFRMKDLPNRSLEALLSDLGNLLPARRTVVQDELVRRNTVEIHTALKKTLDSGNLSTQKETWVAWTLGRMNPGDSEWDRFFQNLALSSRSSFNLRIQSIRIMALRNVTPTPGLLLDTNPRIQFETLLSLSQIQTLNETLLKSVMELMVQSDDRLVDYAAWQCMRKHLSSSRRKTLLMDPQPQIRLASLLSLLEDHSLTREEVATLTQDADPTVASLATQWMQGKSEIIIRGRPLQRRPDSENTMNRSHPEITFLSNIASMDGPDAGFRPAYFRDQVRAFTDRDWLLSNIPVELLDEVFIQTPCNESLAENRSLKFHCNYENEVWIGYDSRLKQMPDWMSAFEDTGLSFEAGEMDYRLYKKPFSAGEILLGSNVVDNSSVPSDLGHYLVIVRPRLLQPPDEQTEESRVMEVLKKGDRNRGRDLFLSKQGAGCFQCHKMEDRGQILGPDLSNIGSRATPEFIVRSMLNPSHDITEGFSQWELETKDGESIVGLMVQETGNAITLAQADGSQTTIPSSQIRNRQSLPSSAMPAFGEVLTPIQVADLTAYLLSRRSQEAEIKQSERSATSPRQLSFSRDERSLTIHLAENAVATYLWEHPEMTRPAWINLRTPSNIPVTRPFPASTDADHRWMHPGLSMAFGWLEGNDYWRMKAPVRHVQFLEEPSVKNGKLKFKVLNRYLDEEQQRTVCMETVSYEWSINRHGFLMEIEHKFMNPDRDFTFGDQEESGLCIRVDESLRVDKGSGRITNDQGGINGEGTWGKPFDWVDYSGLIQGRRIGVLIQPSPNNPRRSWAHSRDYGLVVANPFPRQPKEQKEPYVRTLVPAGTTFGLAYAVQIYEADPDTDLNSLSQVHP